MGSWTRTIPEGARPWVLALALVVAFALGGVAFGGGASSAGDAGRVIHTADEHAGQQGASTWTCSMHPQIRSAQPGACPLCGMDLIPLTSSDDDQDSPARVSLSERARTLARLRTAPVQRLPSSEVDMRLLGRVDYDESRLRDVSAWTAGRIDRLHVRVTGEEVRRGQTIATLYSPEVYAAHQDLIAAQAQVRRLGQSTPATRGAALAALEATRERLRLLGIPAGELDAMERQPRPRRQVAIRSPSSGTVIARQATQGAYVQTGSVLYRVADLSRVWVQLDAYERDLATLSVGQTVQIHVDALPEQEFAGAITFIDPTLDARRRVARVRVEVDNPTGALRPGMFAEAVVHGSVAASQPRPLVVPESAALFTGRRSVVYVEHEGEERPVYEATVVRLGPRMGDVYPVVAGLAEGERVVIHGAFALDADLQIRGGHSMMTLPDDSQARVFDDVVEISPEFRAALAPVVESYLRLQEALAGDDVAASKAAAAVLRDAVRAFHPTAPPAAATAWREIAAHLAHHADEAATAADIETIRHAFEALSQQTATILRRFGNPVETPLRVAHCPMAFSNEGAEWVQRGDTVDNAYFGQVMRTCGEIRHEVEPGGYLVAPESAAGGPASSTVTSPSADSSTLGAGHRR